MTTVQFETAGVARYKFIGRDRKRVELRSSARIEPPTIFPGCPVPSPGGDPDGYGTRWRKVRPADPADPALADAGFVDVGGVWSIYPSQCEAGADIVIPLDAPALDWDAYLGEDNADGLPEFPMGLRLEVGLWRHLFNGATVPPQSLFLGLSDPAGDNVIAVGWLGERERVSLPIGLGPWLRYNGADIVRDVMLDAQLGVVTAGSQVDMTMTRVSGGELGRRGILLWSDHVTGAPSDHNFDDSMFPVAPADWLALMSKLRDGTMRPSVIITHRAGGPANTSRLDFFNYRIS